MRILSFTNQKGGTGKTTTAVNVAAGLALLGKTVLLIDADPQGDATTSSGLSEWSQTLCDVYEGADINAAIQSAGSYDMITSGGVYLANEETKLIGRDRGVLQKEIRKIRKKYDYILIDCPPALSALTVNALRASTEAIIPIRADFLSLKAVARLRDTLNVIHGEIGGIVMTHYSPRRKLDQGVRSELQKEFGSKLFDTVIPASIKVAEAPSIGMTIFEYAPKSAAAAQYAALAREIMEKLPSV